MNENPETLERAIGQALERHGAIFDAESCLYFFDKPAAISAATIRSYIERVEKAA